MEIKIVGLNPFVIRSMSPTMLEDTSDEIEKKLGLNPFVIRSMSPTTR